jgi:hypothetical protein
VTYVLVVEDELKLGSALETGLRGASDRLQAEAE